MRLNAHLSFNGECRAAFEYYEKCLGGTITFMMTYENSPLGARMPPGMGTKIIHASLTVGDNELSGGDAQPEHYEKPQGFSVLLSVADPAEAERMFTGLAENGRVQMPLQETFWALRFGMLTDQFGTPWTINCGRPA